MRLLRFWTIWCATAFLITGTTGMTTAGTGMVELLNPTGARQAAMGETAPFHNPDPFSLEYNPAAVAGLKKGIVGLTHTESILNRVTNAFAAAFPVKSVDCGVILRLSSIGDIEGRGDIPTSEPLYTFSAYDFALQASGAVRITSRFRAGMSAGWLMEKIDTYRGSSGAVGIGAAYQFDHGVSAHASVANLGPKFTLISDEENLPTVYRIGGSMHWREATANLDYVNIKSGEGHLHAGGEYLIRQMLFLRAGYQTGYDNRSFTAGAGFVHKNIGIDYAFVPYSSNLGTVHRISATYAIK